MRFTCFGQFSDSVLTISAVTANLGLTDPIPFLTIKHKFNAIACGGMSAASTFTASLGSHCRHVITRRLRTALDSDSDGSRYPHGYDYTIAHRYPDADYHPDADHYTNRDGLANLDLYAVSDLYPNQH